MRYILMIGISVVLSTVVCSMVFLLQEKKQGYVDMVKLNEEFELKINLQQKLDKELKGYHQIIDSLKFEAQRVYNDSSLIGDQRFVMVKQLQTDIETKTYQFAQQEEELTEKYNAQIWEQLNEYVKLYGENSGVDILFGAAGQGTILYGKEEYDLTNECIAFVNSKYRGE